MTFGSYARLVSANRNFRLLWFAQIISEIGDWFYSIAVLSFVIQTTGSARSMAFAFVMQVLPQVLASPFAGILNDRLSRRRIMIATDWARAVIVLAMLLVRGPGTIWLLYLLLFLETTMWALFEPARTASIPNFTEGEETAVANALSSATWAVAFALGAGLGGIVQAYFGRPAVFVIDSISFACSALLLTRLQFHEPHAEGHPPMGIADLFDYSGIRDGFRYARASKQRLSAMFVKAGLGLMGVNWVLLPVLGQTLFPVHLPGVAASEAGTLGMSFLLSARGAGAMAGSILGAVRAGNSPSILRQNILIGFCLGSIGYLLLGLAPGLAIALLCVFIAHAGGSAAWTGSTTLLQQLTEDKFRGRVFSSEYAMSMVVISIASYSCGAAIDAGWPVRTICFVSGIAVLTPALLWWISGRKNGQG